MSRRRDCRECDGEGRCAACGGSGLGDWAIDADDECPDCDGGGVCRWCDGRGYVDAGDVDAHGWPVEPARDMGGRLPVAGDWREPRR